jgi:hypothetical protein
MQVPTPKVTAFNVGSFCLSEDECIAQGINFAAYERGVSDAADAFLRNASALTQTSEPQMAFCPACFEEVGPECLNATERDAARWRAVAAAGGGLTLRLHNSRPDHREAVIDAAISAARLQVLTRHGATK